MQRMGVLCFGAAVTSTLILLCALPAAAHKKKTPADRSLCKANFSVVQEDALKNITQGLSKKDAKWFEKDIQKKYPDVCYVPAAPDVPLVFFLTVTPDVYHGTKVVTDSQTNDSPVSGTVTNEDGSTSSVDGTVTTTTTSSTAVPYSFRYGIFTLAIETKQPHGKWIVRHRFQQRGIYHTLYGIPLGKLSRA